MLYVTDSAAGHLADLLSDAPDDAAVRFVPEGSRLAMELDTEQPDDLTFCYADRTVLILNSRLAEAMSEMTLDLVETLDGPKLRLTTPDDE